MKKTYKSPVVRIIEVEAECILADSLLNDADQQGLNLNTNEVLDGEDIEIF